MAYRAQVAEVSFDEKKRRIRRLERDEPDPGSPALNEEVTRQASIIAYANDFKFLFLVTPPLAVLVLFMRLATSNGGAEAAAAH